MKKGTLLLLFSIVLLGGGVALSSSLPGRTQSNVPSTLGQQPQRIQVPVVLRVPEANYTVSLPKGSSVYNLLLKAQKETDFAFSGREFPVLGFFVEEINGIKQNPRAGKYWIYYINDEKAKVGVSAYKPRSHDIISWKYEDEE